MYTFKDFVGAVDESVSDEEWIQQLSQEGELEEALDAQARMKLKQAMRKNKAKIALARKKAMGKKASKEKLQKRARKQAVSMIKKKLLQGRDESELGFSARKDLEKKVEKKKGAVNKLAKKLLKKVRQDEKERMAKK